MLRNSAMIQSASALGKPEQFGSVGTDQSVHWKQYGEHLLCGQKTKHYLLKVQHYLLDTSFLTATDLELSATRLFKLVAWEEAPPGTKLKADITAWAGALNYGIESPRTREAPPTGFDKTDRGHKRAENSSAFPHPPTSSNNICSIFVPMTEYIYFYNISSKHKK